MNGHRSSVLGLRSKYNSLENHNPPVSQPTTRTVAIVLDPDFSSRLASLAARAAVWIVDSPENRPAIESLWTARRTRGAEYDVTVFRTIPGLSPEEHVDGVVRSVEKQVDPDDTDATVRAIEVYGGDMTDAMRSTFHARGFTTLESLGDGFRAQHGGKR